MPTDETTGRLILKTITVRLTSEASRQHAEARQELVLSALAAALIAVDDSTSPAWTVQAMRGEPLAYDLAPLPDRPVSVQAAWAMTHALRGQPQIAAAEPLFMSA